MVATDPGATGRAGDERREGGSRVGASFTDRVRRELSRVATTSPGDVVAELAGLLHLAGGLHRTEAGIHLELPATSGAVARRAFSLVQQGYGVPPEFRVGAPGGVRRHSTYVVVIRERATDVARDVGLVGPDGRPQPPLPDAVVGQRSGRTAYVRGAILAAGSVSAPGRAAHLEIVAGSRLLAQRLADLVARVSDHRAGVARGSRGWRAVVKSGDGIGALLGGLGASQAYLAWEEHRLRRQLRAHATRLANADAANLRRAVAAAAEQVRAVERTIALVGWAEVPDDLREVALARLANPSASLGEIGELCDPPVGKSSVMRRLRRLEAMADDLAAGGPR